MARSFGLRVGLLGIGCALAALMTACGGAGGGTPTAGAATGGAKAGSGSAAPVCPPAGAAATGVACMMFGESPKAAGLAQEEPGGSTGDSEYHPDTIGGRPAFVFDQNSADANNSLSYLYFQVDPTGSVLAGNPSTLYLTVTYYDSPAAGQLYAEYDSSDTSAPVNGAYEAVAPKVQTTGAAAWKTVTWTLSDASFEEQENGKADFRLDGTSGLAVGSASVSLKAPPKGKA